MAVHQYGFLGTFTHHRLIANKAESNGVEQALGQGPLEVIAIAEDDVPRHGLGLNDRLSKRILPNTLNAAPEVDDVGTIFDPVLSHLDWVGSRGRIYPGPHVCEANDREHASGKAELRANLFQNSGPSFRRDYTIVDGADEV